MKIRFFLFTILIGLLIFSCNKEEPPIDPTGPNPPVTPPGPTLIKVDKLDGSIQKGPYLNGTSVTIFEMDSSFVQTGRSFATEITDNSGSYTIQNLEVESPFVILRANGFYFNEVLNRNSTAQLSLSAISDITDQSSLNINLLSTLEKERVELLVGQGMTLAAAKNQAQSEILAILEISNSGSTESELRDISQDGDENAMLLALSVIFQGQFENVAELSQLLADVRSDLLNDGTLDNDDLGMRLASNSQKLNTVEIRNNLESKFADLGLSNAIVPPFEKYITNFLDNTPYAGASGITYPETGKYGLNIIHPSFVEYTGNNNVALSMIAELEEGSHLRVKVSHPGMKFGYRGDQQNTGWNVVSYDWNGGTAELESINTGTIDFDVRFLSPTEPFCENEITIEIYENYSVSPTRVHKILFPNEVPQIEYPINDSSGINILYNHPGVSGVPTSMIANICDNQSVSVKITGEGWNYNEASLENWIVTDLDPSDRSRVFSADGTGEYHVGIDLFSFPSDSTTNYRKTTLFEISENGVLIEIIEIMF